jgi:L-arabinonolactonase
MARVAVVGSGFIGRARTITFARAGHDVALWDEDPRARQRAIDFIASVAPDLAANDLLDGSRPEALLARLRVEKTLGAALADADHVQESASERLDVKKAQGRPAGSFRHRLDGFRRTRAGRQTVSPRSGSLGPYADGRILYFADTSRRAIYANDYDTATGQVQSRRLFANFETLRGFPDGATVDEEGYVWSVEVGRLIRFDPLGVIDRIVGLPVRSTTSLIFGGANLNVAYVTSMARPMNGQYHREREAVVCSRSMISACAACPNRALLADWDYRSTRTIMRIEVIVDVKTTLGEGPLWDVEQERLYWIDSFDGRVFRATVAGGEIRCWDVPQKIGSMALRKDGSGAVVSLARGFHLLDFKSGDVELIIDPEPDKQNNRLNDGKVDKRGRFVAGSMDTMEEGPNGALYRLDPDFSLHKLDEKIIVSNGPCWSPDGATFYFADTWTGDIWAYDYDQSTGAASNRRTFVSVDRSRGGAADGSTVDAEGCLWNALVYDGRLVRYDPSGRIDRVIDMPVKKITSVMFGGPNLDILFITSMAKPPLPRFPGDGRLRGSLFAIYDLGIRGLPEPRFGA